MFTTNTYMTFEHQISEGTYIRTFYLCKSIYFVYIILCKENGIKLN